MPITMNKKAGTATTTIQHKQGGKVIAEDETVTPVGEEKILVGTTCQVGVEASFTKNLGDYNSVKIGVTLSVPCPHSEVVVVFEYTKKWVNDRLEAMLAEIA